MAGPDAHGAQSAEQSITVDSLHSPPNSAGTAGARQGDPGPVHRVIPGGGRHDRPATRPTDRSGTVPPSNRGGGLYSLPTLLPPSQSDPPPYPAGVAGPREAAPPGTGLEHLAPSPPGPPPRPHPTPATPPAPAGRPPRNRPAPPPPATSRPTPTPPPQHRHHTGPGRERPPGPPEKQTTPHR